MAVSLSLSITQNSQSIGNNTSNVTVTVTCSWTYGSYNLNQKDGWLRIDGVTYPFTNSFNGSVTTTGSKTLFTKTVDVKHYDDGTKTLMCAAYYETGVSSGDISASGSKVLTTIPRTSTPAVSAASVDMGDKITIRTQRKSNTLTHDLAYSFAGSAYKTFATGVGASYEWTTPDLASSIPNAASGTLTIRCTTKSGSTAIGSATVTTTLKVPASVVPTVSSVTVKEATEGLAARFGAYIQNKSTLNVSVTGAGVKGSTIASYKTYVAGLPYEGQTFTSGTLVSSGTVSVVASVTDTRGRTASKTVTISVLEYNLPKTTEFRAFRCDADGSPKDDGIYMGVSYAYSVTSLGGKNTASMVIAYKTEAGSSWTSLATGSDLDGSGIRFFADGPTFSTDYQFNVRMTVTDWFGATTSYTATLPTADVVLDISSDGKGLGIGKVSQREGATEFARTLYDKFDTLIGNGLAAYTGSTAGSIDANTTLEHLVVTNKNTPTTEFWYVTTVFYSTKSATANRAQYAIPYVYNASMYMRVYNGGFWRAWAEIPVLTANYYADPWHVRIWSDSWVELTGSCEVANLPCNTALGNWYRTAVFTPGYFPVEIENPVVSANYESAGYGALLWATTEATTYSMPSYYLIRPTSATIATGKIKMRVTGKMIDPGI